MIPVPDILMLLDKAEKTLKGTLVWIRAASGIIDDDAQYSILDIEATLKEIEQAKIEWSKKQDKVPKGIFVDSKGIPITDWRFFDARVKFLNTKQRNRIYVNAT